MLCCFCFTDDKADKEEKLDLLPLRIIACVLALSMRRQIGSHTPPQSLFDWHIVNSKSSRCYCKHTMYILVLDFQSWNSITYWSKNDTCKRLKRDRHETGKRLTRGLNETGKRLARDRKETEKECQVTVKRLAIDWKETRKRLGRNWQEVRDWQKSGKRRQGTGKRMARYCEETGKTLAYDWLETWKKLPKDLQETGKRLARFW